MQHNIREAKMGVLRQEPNFLLAVAGSAIQANLWQKEAVAWAGILNGGGQWPVSGI